LALATTAAPSPSGRKIRRLGITVAVIVILYSVGWFYVASKFETFLGQFVNHGGPGNISLQCEKLTATDVANLFRFSLGFNCDKTSIRDEATGSELTAGPLAVLARIYNPGLANIDLQGPAKVTFADGTTLDARWQRLGSSLRANFNGLTELSLEGDLPSLKINSPNFYAPFDLRVREGQFHTRQNNGDLDLAAIANDFEWVDGEGNAVLPKLSTSVDLKLYGKEKLLEGKPVMTRPMKGELRAFKIQTPDGLYGEMSGPFTIDEDGYISGTFRTTLEKLDLWDQKLRQIFPEAGDTISGVAALLKGLAKGGDKVTVNLRVDRGRISLSMLPLGKIPPI
jgi:hypothetical protein